MCAYNFPLVTWLSHIFTLFLHAMISWWFFKCKNHHLGVTVWYPVSVGVLVLEIIFITVILKIIHCILQVSMKHTWNIINIKLQWLTSILEHVCINCYKHHDALQQASVFVIGIRKVKVKVCQYTSWRYMGEWKHRGEWWALCPLCFTPKEMTASALLSCQGRRENGEVKGSKEAQVEGRVGSDQFEQVAESAITVLTAGL